MMISATEKIHFDLLGFRPSGLFCCERQAGGLMAEAQQTFGQDNHQTGSSTCSKRGSAWFMCAVIGIQPA